MASVLVDSRDGKTRKWQIPSIHGYLFYNVNSPSFLKGEVWISAPARNDNWM
jgi:hypothetical protein